MNPLQLLPFAALLIVSPAPALFAQASATIGVARQDTVFVTLGYGSVHHVQPLPSPRFVNVNPGSELHLKTGYDESGIVSIEWFKDLQRLRSASKTLSFTRTLESDSGRYHAHIVHAQGTETTNTVHIRVTNPVRQQLLALSTRATLSASSPTLVGGFVIAPAPGSLSEYKTVLIRAVGPSLSTLGVSNPLAAPTLTIFNGSGDELLRGTPVSTTASHWDPRSDPTLVAAAVGAFPLLPNSNDIAMVLNLSSGVYTAHIGSINGGTGDVLFEIYEAPDSLVISPLAPPVPPPSPSGSATASPAPSMVNAPSAPVELPPVAPFGSNL